MCKNISVPTNILITGASSGIGEALAVYYAEHGARTLFLSGRNAERLETVAQKCRQFGTAVYPKIIDVTDRNAMSDWLTECNEIAKLELVFANAGISTGTENTTNIYNTFNTNIIGVLNTVLPTVDIYKKCQTNNPKIIAITASIAGYHGLPSCPSYSATKACVKAYGEALRGDLREFGIQVNVICPGFVKSRITDKNTCPMPFFMSAEKAATVIAARISRNVGLIAFPWPMRFASWLISALPNCLSDFIYSRLPHKV